jgi:aminoglycoside phosphotransferase (APT) family kinase protein
MNDLPQQLALPASSAPPVHLIQALAKADVPETNTPFVPLRGGRTNRLWRFGITGGWVCKLFARAGGTPLFPNDPIAEVTALTALNGTGLVPEHGQLVESNAGTCLVYRYIEGAAWNGAAYEVGAMMARLHSYPIPEGLRRLDNGRHSILEQADRILSATPNGPKRLAAFRPSIDDLKTASPVFLHGDIVPANIVVSPLGLRLIDWQCPAFGDPVEDVAIFLSPAMQLLYGGRDLDSFDEREFFDGYGHPERAVRYKALKPAFAWRMAAYCLWKAARGDANYAAAAEAEIDTLKQLS